MLLSRRIYPKLEQFTVLRLVKSEWSIHSRKGRAALAHEAENQITERLP
jgi:hypothetical protein